jgi:hypothetical protein
LGVSPGIVEMSPATTPGYTYALTVSNDGDEPFHAIAYPGDWTVTQSGDIQFALAGSGLPFACGDWIELSPAEFDLDPGKSVLVRFTVKVPPDARDGSRQAAIYIQTVPKPVPGRAVVAVSGRIAVKVFVQLPGDPKPAVRLQDLALGRLKPSDPNTLLLSAKNEGSWYATLTGAVEVTPENAPPAQEPPADAKAEAANAPSTTPAFPLRLEVPETTLLPQSARDISLQLPASLPPGGYRAEAQVQCKGGELMTLRGRFDVVRAGRVSAVAYQPPSAKSQAQVKVAFKNEGTFETLAGGSVTISDEAGKAIVRLPLAALSVPAGATRELTASFPQPPAQGRYVAAATVEYGGDGHAQGQGAFSAGGPPDAKVVSFAAANASKDDGVTLKLSVENTGGWTLSLSGSVEILNSAGQQVARLVLPEATAAPGQTVPIETQWPGPIPSGAYKATLMVSGVDGKTLQAEASFAVAP